MARKSKEATAQSKAKVIQEAAKIFRLKGYDGTSLDDVMKAAGLTVGTFYAHFSSKTDLFKAVLEYGNRAAYEKLMPLSVRQTQGDGWLRLFIQHYITEKHRDSVGTGCFFPVLATDVARSSPEAKLVLESALKNTLKKKAAENKKLSPKEAEEQILSAFCGAVGALVLSRAVASRSFSKRILDTARKAELKQMTR
jgi:TetR/AcrR family transcriptional repressor of nem operon